MDFMADRIPTTRLENQGRPENLDKGVVLENDSPSAAARIKGAAGLSTSSLPETFA